MPNTGGISGYNYSQTVTTKQASIGNLSAAQTAGATKMTFGTEAQVADKNARVLDLTKAPKTEAEFQDMLKVLDDNSGTDFIKVCVNKNHALQEKQYAYISLSALDKVNNANGQNKRDELIGLLKKAIQDDEKDPSYTLKGLTLELPYAVLKSSDKSNANEVTQEYAGGITFSRKYETSKTQTPSRPPLSVAAEDLSKVENLKDPRVTSQGEIVDKMFQTDGLALTSGEKMNPTTGLNVNTTKGQEQVREMIDAYLRGGNFNLELYHKQDAKGHLTPEAQQYRKEVKAGLADLIGDGLKQLTQLKPPPSLPTGVNASTDLAQKFMEKIFEDKTLNDNDIRMIQTGFAAMAHNTKYPDNGFKKLQEMPNPDNGEVPKNQGIDGVPALRFAVVTSTLSAMLSKKITETQTSKPGKVVQGPVSFETLDKLYQTKQGNKQSILEAQGIHIHKPKP